MYCYRQTDEAKRIAAAAPLDPQSLHVACGGSPDHDSRGRREPRAREAARRARPGGVRLTPAYAMVRARSRGRTGRSAALTTAARPTIQRRGHGIRRTRDQGKEQDPADEP